MTTPLDPWSQERPAFPGTQDIDLQAVFAGPGYQAPRTRTDPVAVAALVLAVLAGIPGAGLVGALLGVAAIGRLRESYDTGVGQAWFAVIVGGAATVIWLWILWVTTR